MVSTFSLLVSVIKVFRFGDAMKYFMCSICVLFFQRRRTRTLVRRSSRAGNVLHLRPTNRYLVHGKNLRMSVIQLNLECKVHGGEVFRWIISEIWMPIRFESLPVPTTFRAVWLSGACTYNAVPTIIVSPLHSYCTFFLPRGVESEL